MSIIVSLRELAAHVRDGQKLAVPSDFSGFYSGIAMEATRELIRRGVRDLHVVGLPTTGLQADLLLGAGCVATLEASSVFMGEYGVPPCFQRAFKAQSFRMIEATCPAIHAAFQAGEKRIPFIPLRGILGSDVVRLRTDWKVIDNPFAADDPILLLPAINPDWALFHAPMADRHGNVYYGRRRELAVMAHASTGTLATVEKLYDGDLMEDPALACATLPSLYVDAVSVVPHGAAPYGFGDFYAEDEQAMWHYMESAKTEEGLRAYLDAHVFATTEALS
ncbi:3-oxoadipate CoA-transferase subunit A [Variovorax sp. SRS16]|uniref:CoA transferase subunit A n=1 Tax=Variovorax sp. SRS16 TaxID=282217 RepID=UPI0013182E89|nr:CoA transferase subunit A [Variovorax sp. SRS16]VTU15688.1 3-oxoadipate CoA-transferase subunit A [Variovorax sp. SRS16]